MVVVGGIKPPRVTLNLPQSCFLELEHEMLLAIVPHSKQENISSKISHETMSRVR